MKGSQGERNKNYCVISFLFLVAGCGSRSEKPVTKTNFVLNTIITVSAYGPGTLMRWARFFAAFLRSIQE